MFYSTPKYSIISTKRVFNYSYIRIYLFIYLYEYIYVVSTVHISVRERERERESLLCIYAHIQRHVYVDIDGYKISIYCMECDTYVHFFCIQNVMCMFVALYAHSQHISYNLKCINVFPN